MNCLIHETTRPAYTGIHSNVGCTCRTLFDVAPHPRHRTTDPTTSAQACRSVTATHTETAILTAFRHAPAGLTDDELATLLEPAHCPPTTKTARSRLSGRGVLVDTGLRRLSLRGRDMVVWGRA